MYSRLSVLLLLLAVSCMPYSRIRMMASGEMALGVSISDDLPNEEDADYDIDSLRGTFPGDPIIMNAVRDSVTGEMVATDVIKASRVVAKFRNVAERAGLVSISFDVCVPSGMSDSRWQLRISPQMYIQNDTLSLEQIYITGAAYRAAQLRGYERYQAFLAGIITDSLDMMRLRSLEVFLQRHFPDTYAMKTDSSVISQPTAENLFGVTQRQALEHYKMHFKIRKNDRRRARSGQMFKRFVKSPIITEGVRLDTVFAGDCGDFVYRYVHTFRSRPRLRKVNIALSGSLYEDGDKVLSLPFSDELTFYISTLSSLIDQTSIASDSLYMAGVMALQNFDYKAAVTHLRPYGDYNAALALVAADYNHTALDLLQRLDHKEPKVCYLKALVLCRIGSYDEALECFKEAVALDPHLKHRANLDPEMYELVSLFRDEP